MESRSKTSLFRNNESITMDLNVPYMSSSKKQFRDKDMHDLKIRLSLNTIGESKYDQIFSHIKDLTYYKTEEVYVFEMFNLVSC